MSTMVEKVAQAIADNINAALPDGVEIDAHYAARAAIEAMKEPTEAMLNAVADEEDKRGIPNSVIDALIAEEAWPLMIDAALKEEGQ